MGEMNDRPSVYRTAWVLPVTLFLGFFALAFSQHLTGSYVPAIVLLAAVVIGGRAFLFFRVLRMAAPMKRREDMTMKIQAVRGKLQTKVGDEPNRNWRLATKRFDATVAVLSTVSNDFTRQCLNGLKRFEILIDAGEYTEAVRIIDLLKAEASQHLAPNFAAMQLSEMANRPQNRAERRRAKSGKGSVARLVVR